MKGMASAQSLDEVKELSGNFFQPGQLVNGFITNSQGFVSPEVRYAKDPDTIRIVFIGDSFGVGIVPYQKHFIRVLEKKLNEEGQLAKRVEVVNLSAPAIGPTVYERLFSLEAIKYHPDLVIVSFFVGNDFNDDVYSAGPSKMNQNEFTSNVAKNWKTYALVTNLIKVKLQNPGAVAPASLAQKDPTNGQVLGTYTGEGLESYDFTIPSIPIVKYMEILSWKMRLFDPRDTSAEPAIQSTEKTLQTLIADAQTAKVPLYVVVIPDELQVNDQVFGALTTSTLADPHYDITAPQRRLEHLFNAEQVPFLDVLPIFLQRTDKEVLYHPQDTHIDTLGNAVVGEALYQTLLPKLQNEVK